VIGDPLSDGAVKLTVAEEDPPTALTFVGNPGVVAGVTDAEGSLAAPVPATLVAVTVNVYAVPLVRPDTMIGDDAPVAVNPPGDDVTVYPVIVAPPLLAGAEKLTVTNWLPRAALVIVGAPGTVLGVIDAEGLLEALDPYTFLAVTVNVYAVPFVSPETIMGDDAPVAVSPPGDDVTV
jgi:hypothetical protein